MGAACVKAQTPQQWRDSVSVLMDAIQKQPQNIDLRLKKAEANINLQQWDYAIDEYGRVLRLDNRNLAAYFFRAYCLTRLRHYDQAKADYDNFLAIEPVHFEARLGLAHILQLMGKQRDAADELNHIVQLFPDSADAYAARAAFEMEQQQYDVAVYDWEQAVRLRPDNMDFCVSKVDALILLGRKREAREALDKLVEKGTPRGALKEWYEKVKK